MKEKTEKLLEEIRDLLILQLTKIKTNSEEIGRLIGMDSSSVRHILAGTKYKKKKKNDE